MSAFVVSDNHINSMISYTRSIMRGQGTFSVYHDRENITFNLQDNDESKKLAQILLDENCRSVNHRYASHIEATSDEKENHVIDFKRVALIDGVTMLKAIDCYRYQSCETDDFEETLASKVVRAMQSHTIRSLKGYDDAPWGIA